MSCSRSRFSITAMASALSSIDSKKQICRGRLETIGNYLLLHKVNTELRSKILEYYEYLYTSSQSMEDLRLLHDLPPSLATRLAITVHKRLVARAPLFNALSDLALLNVLAKLTREGVEAPWVVQLDHHHTRRVVRTHAHQPRTWNTRRYAMQSAHHAQRRFDRQSR